ncbi:MAG: thioredoxin [Chitinophagales bacterium]|nr:thioredoxin [Chitinophagales bacterium]HAE12883.1 thioredoxin [Bacteroidota bacterium]MCB9020854.1 thioredoxin [Chitinophagales bacterium]MCB9031228.1 thioredoxin [Chitinophagales bacterium]HAE35631.1 thioredoxin [Bacteroidota bacterium]
MATEFTDANFKEQVLDSDKLTVIDFWAVWCGPCRMVAPVIEELAKDYDGQVNIGKVDVDSNPMVSQQFGIRNIPTILFVKNGEVVDKQVGAVPRSVLEAKMKQHM